MAGMARYGQILLRMNRWLAQIDLVAPGGPSKEAKAESGWSKLVYYSRLLFTYSRLPFTYSRVPKASTL